MKKLNDKVVLVTGSTTGIGKAIAMQCLAEGASVMFHGLEKDLAEKIAFDLSATEYNENFKRTRQDAEEPAEDARRRAKQDTHSVVESFV